MNIKNCGESCAAQDINNVKTGLSADIDFNLLHFQYKCLYRKDSTMLVTIQQTKANSENLFEVSSNGQLLFQAKAPWMKLSLPFNAENLRELTFSNPAGETVYTTRYKFIDNLVEESIPFKYLLTKGQRFGQFEIIGKDGSEGVFYVMQNGLFDSKFCIECMGKAYRQAIRSY